MICSFNWIYGGFMYSCIIRVRVYIIYFHEINRYMITIYHQQNEIRVRFSMLSIIFFTLKKREEDRPDFNHVIMLSNPEHNNTKCVLIRKFFVFHCWKFLHIWIFFKPPVSYYAKCRCLLGSTIKWIVFCELSKIVWNQFWLVELILFNVSTCTLYWIQNMSFVLRIFLFTLLFNIQIPSWCPTRCTHYRKCQKKVTDEMFLFLDRQQFYCLEARYIIISESSQTLLGVP